jgi:beta-glucosidase
MRCIQVLALSSFGAVQPALANPLTWPQALTKAQDFVSKLSITEKIGVVSGGYVSPSLPCVGTIGPVPHLGFEGICLSDGPTGYARSDGVSVFPSGITTAATWDRDLMFQRAVALGKEFRAKGAHVILGFVLFPHSRTPLLMMKAGKLTTTSALLPDPWAVVLVLVGIGRASALILTWRGKQ